MIFQVRIQCIKIPGSHDKAVLAVVGEEDYDVTWPADGIFKSDDQVSEVLSKAQLILTPNPLRTHVVSGSSVDNPSINCLFLLKDSIISDSRTSLSGSGVHTSDNSNTRDFVFNRHMTSLSPWRYIKVNSVLDDDGYVVKLDKNSRFNVLSANGYPSINSTYRRLYSQCKEFVYSTLEGVVIKNEDLTSRGSPTKALRQIEEIKRRTVQGIILNFLEDIKEMDASTAYPAKDKDQIGQPTDINAPVKHRTAEDNARLFENWATRLRIHINDFPTTTGSIRYFTLTKTKPRATEQDPDNNNDVIPQLYSCRGRSRRVFSHLLGDEPDKITNYLVKNYSPILQLVFEDKSKFQLVTELRLFLKNEAVYGDINRNMKFSHLGLGTMMLKRRDLAVEPNDLSLIPYIETEGTVVPDEQPDIFPVTKSMLAGTSLAMSRARL